MVLPEGEGGPPAVRGRGGPQGVIPEATAWEGASGDVLAGEPGLPPDVSPRVPSLPPR